MADDPKKADTKSADTAPPANDKPTVLQSKKSSKRTQDTSPLEDGRKPYTLLARRHDGVDESGNRKLYTVGDTVYLTDVQARSFAGSFQPLGAEAGDGDEADVPRKANQVKDGSLIMPPSAMALTAEQVAAENQAKVVGDPHDAPEFTGKTPLGGNPTTAEAARNVAASAPDAGGTGPVIDTRAAQRKKAADADNKVDVATGSPKVVPAATK